ncbi:MAG: SGNH/GDSL hydrolase family protein [Gemmataceae bacterium]
MKLPRYLAILSLLVFPPTLQAARSASFAEFDRRAKAGETLNVVFFGSSLTWGANASDPQHTSYRALLSARIKKTYPKARFQFWDASIGGTNSQLAAFRLDRDVLRRKPHLVIVEFTANDDMKTLSPETLAAYESVIRRIIAEAKAPVVQAILPFQWHVTGTKLEALKRRNAHIAIAQAYNTAVADGVVPLRTMIGKEKSIVAQLWPIDRIHPGDKGYRVFADIIEQALQRAIKAKSICQLPKKLIHADTYLKCNRVRLAKLGSLPKGWRSDIARRTSAHYDMLMSRWLDGVIVAENGKLIPQPKGPKKFVPQKVDRWKMAFRAKTVLLFGESTLDSGSYRVYLDGKRLGPKTKDDKIQDYNASLLASIMGGNTHLVQELATGLDPNKTHTLEIEPILTSTTSVQQLRLESICLAGGPAKFIELKKEKQKQK